MINKNIAKPSREKDSSNFDSKSLEKQLGIPYKQIAFMTCLSKLRYEESARIEKDITEGIYEKKKRIDFLLDLFHRRGYSATFESCYSPHKTPIEIYDEVVGRH